MKNGNVKIDLVETGYFALDGGAMFGVVPKTLWSRAYSAPDELNRITLAARNVLIRTDERKILIDTGNGTKWDAKKAGIYNIDIEKSSADYSLQPFGIGRDEITDVILTHLHFDHCGGSTIESKGEMEPTFPNAKYYVQEEHYRHALNPYDKDSASFFKIDFLPLSHANQLELLDGDTEVIPGIKVHRCWGHSPAMQMVQIDSPERTYLFMADLMPTAAHLPFPYIMAYDNQPLVTLEEKKKWLPKIAENNWAIIFEHDKSIRSATIKPDEKGRNYVINEIINF